MQRALSRSHIIRIFILTLILKVFLTLNVKFCGFYYILRLEHTKNCTWVSCSTPECIIKKIPLFSCSEGWKARIIKYEFNNPLNWIKCMYVQFGQLCYKMAYTLVHVRNIWYMYVCLKWDSIWLVWHYERQMTAVVNICCCPDEDE